MAACDDRQLTEAQRQAAARQQQRAGVMAAVRPFTGTPSVPNLVDYINRELFPAIKQTRAKLNEVFRQVTDNAPSGNPLQYYFATETANADPTTGRLRLDSATQDTATTIRVSETNARLASAAPWLDVMAGGATAPLGVVTLTDVADPTRFLRFDLNTMVDQGSYWDLGVTPVESSHDNPFIDGEPIAIGFIPGVGGITPATVPTASMSDIGAETVLCNPTSSPAPPVDLNIPAMSVLGRSTSTFASGHIEPITVSGSFTGTLFVKTNTAQNVILWRPLTYIDFPDMNNNRFLGNISGATGKPSNTDFYTLAQGTYGVGWDATASQFTVADNAVTDARLRDSAALSVIGRSANSIGDPADIATTAASDAVLRESGSAVSFGTVATGGIANSAITNAKLANMAAGTYKGRSVLASTGAPTDLTGNEAAAGLRFATIVDVASSGTVTSYSPTGFDAATVGIRISPAANLVLRGMPLAAGQQIAIRVGRGSAFTVTLNHEDGAANAGEAFNTPNNVALVMRAGEACIIRNGESRNNIIASGRSTVADADYGDITVSVNGSTWTIDNNTVTDAKLRDSAALSVIGRSANSIGDPADIAAANDGEVLRRSGTAVGFGTIATAGLADASVTLAKMANLAQSTIIGRAEGAGTGVPQALTAAQVAAIIDNTAITWTALQTFNGSVIWNNDQVESGSLPMNITLGDSVNKLFINTAGDGEIQTIGGTSTAGRIVKVYILTSGLKTFKHGSGTGAQRMFWPGNRDHVLGLRQSFELVGENTGSGWRVTDVPIEYTDKGDITVSSTGSTWTIDSNVVSDAKLRQSAGVSVIGRSANSTGNVADITAGADDRVLVRRSGALAFTTIVNNDITNGTIDPTTKIAGIGANTVLGNDTAITANPTIISVGTNTVLGRVAGNIVAAQVATGQIADAAVTLAKMADLAQSRIIGRAEGAGTGVPTSLTPTQVVAVIDGEDVTWTGNHIYQGTNAFKIQSGSGLLVEGSGSGGVVFITEAASAPPAVTAVGTFWVKNDTPNVPRFRDDGGTDHALVFPEINTVTWTGVHNFSAAVNANAGAYLAGMVRLDGILTSTDGSPIDNKAIGQISVWRCTPSNTTTLLRGMVASAAGQVVDIYNLDTTNTLQVQPEDTSSTAANRFSLSGTSLSIGPLRSMRFWYDATSSRWRPNATY